MKWSFNNDNEDELTYLDLLTIVLLILGFASFVMVVYLSLIN